VVAEILLFHEEHPATLSSILPYLCLRMSKVLRKLITNQKRLSNAGNDRSLEQRIQNIKAIWNNDHHDDVGIEKIFRLLLAASQFLFPGIYIKHYFGRINSQSRDIAMDVYILCKVIIPLIIIYTGYQNNLWATLWVLWSFLETLLYVPSLIFASDVISRPSSYRRSLLLLFFNYLEIVFAFALLYAQGNHLNMPFTHWFDCIYYSCVTMGTIGFGEYHPITGFGKFLVCLQSIIFYAFVVLFINFFTNKIETKSNTHSDN
jgi:hypothetical protein